MFDSRSLWLLTNVTTSPSPPFCVLGSFIYDTQQYSFKAFSESVFETLTHKSLIRLFTSLVNLFKLTSQIWYVVVNYTIKKKRKKKGNVINITCTTCLEYLVRSHNVYLTEPKYTRSTFLKRQDIYILNSLYNCAYTLHFVTIKRVTNFFFFFLLHT